MSKSDIQYTSTSMFKVLISVLSVVVASGVLSIFNMNQLLIRLDERVIHIESRVVTIESRQEKFYIGERSRGPVR